MIEKYINLGLLAKVVKSKFSEYGKECIFIVDKNGENDKEKEEKVRLFFEKETYSQLNLCDNRDLSIKEDTIWISWEIGDLKTESDNVGSFYSFSICFDTCDEMIINCCEEQG